MYVYTYTGKQYDNMLNQTYHYLKDLPNTTINDMLRYAQKNYHKENDLQWIILEVCNKIQKERGNNANEINES